MSPIKTSKRKRVKKESEVNTSAKKSKVKSESEVNDCGSEQPQTSRKEEKKEKTELEQSQQTPSKAKEETKSFLPYSVDQSSLLHSIDTLEVQAWRYTTHKFCDLDEDGVCIVFAEKKAGTSLATIIEAQQNLPCTKSSACGKERSCVNACRRFGAYQVSASFLKYKKRTLLPICVRLYIKQLYGESTTKYKQ
jgi:hypothetical protein